MGEPTKTIALRVKGMTCAHCARRISDALEREDGVVEARVSLEEGSALIRFDPIRTDEQRILNSDVFRDAFVVDGRGKSVSHRYEAIPERDHGLVSGTGDPSDKKLAQAAGSSGLKTIARGAPRSTRSTLFVYLGLFACCLLPFLLLTGAGVAILSSLMGFGLWLALAFVALAVVSAIYAVSRYARGSRKAEGACC